MKTELTKNEAKALERALGHLEKARDIFATLQKSCSAESRWAYFGDFGYYYKQLSEIISCDGGEAGLKALMGIKDTPPTATKNDNDLDETFDRR